MPTDLSDEKIRTDGYYINKNRILREVVKNLTISLYHTSTGHYRKILIKKAIEDLSKLL